MDSSLPQKLEIHYFLSNNSHSMDANIRHKCETQILGIIKEMSTQLNFKVEVESEAYKEGGLIEMWKFIGENANQVTLLLGIIQIYISIYSIPETEQKTIQKEQTNAEIELTKAKTELTKKQSELLDLQLTQYNKKEDKKIEKDSFSVLLRTKKVKKLKSNFYTALNEYKKVTHISSSILDINNKKTVESITVDKSEFSKYIIDDVTETEIDENATIELISPVLKQGNYKWKGIYQYKSIDFYMKDSDFKSSVSKKEVSFTNGISINCILETKTKTDDQGNLGVSNYSVITVLSQTINDKVTETEASKKIRRKRKFNENQLGFEGLD